MMIRASGMVLAAVIVLSCTAASAQSRFSSPRYFNASHSRSMTYVGATHVSGGSCGCSDCGAESCDSCGCDSAPDCGGCGHCGHCCPRILPAVARGVGAVADFVGDTLDCIFCVPRVGCCGTSDCCDRPRACLRPVRRSCCASSNCCDSGCTDCASGYGAPSIPEATPVEEQPMAPAASARSPRSYSVPRTYTTSRTTSTRPVPAVVRSSARRDADYSAKTVSATSSAPKKVAPPRELKIPVEEISQLDIEYKPEVRHIERTNTKSTANRTPTNPLRR